MLFSRGFPKLRSPTRSPDATKNCHCEALLGKAKVACESTGGDPCAKAVAAARVLGLVKCRRDPLADTQLLDDYFGLLPLGCSQVEAVHQLAFQYGFERWDTCRGGTLHPGDWRSDPRGASVP